MVSMVVVDSYRQAREGSDDPCGNGFKSEIISVNSSVVNIDTDSYTEKYL